LAASSRGWPSNPRIKAALLAWVASYAVHLLKFIMSGLAIRQKMTGGSSGYSRATIGTIRTAFINLGAMRVF
jgi:hypothetical protein